METLPLGKIFAVLLVSIILFISKSRNSDLADIGNKLGCAILVIGALFFVFLKVTGEI